MSEEEEDASLSRLIRQIQPNKEEEEEEEEKKREQTRQRLLMLNKDLVLLGLSARALRPVSLMHGMNLGISDKELLQGLGGIGKGRWIRKREIQIKSYKNSLD